MELTPIGKIANAVQTWYGEETDFTGWAWDWLSRGYASGTLGEVRYYSGAKGYEGMVWLNVELPIITSRVEKGLVSIQKVMHP